MENLAAAVPIGIAAIVVSLPGVCQTFAVIMLAISRAITPACMTVSTARLVVAFLGVLGSCLPQVYWSVSILVGWWFWSVIGCVHRQALCVGDALS